MMLAYLGVLSKVTEISFVDWFPCDDSSKDHPIRTNEPVYHSRQYGINSSAGPNIYHWGRKQACKVTYSTLSLYINLQTKSIQQLLSSTQFYKYISTNYMEIFF